AEDGIRDFHVTGVQTCALPIMALPRRAYAVPPWWDEEGLMPVDYIAAVEAAIRAPSLHNTQPWRFRMRQDAIEVRMDPKRRLPASDPTGWAARMSVGAAVYNLRLALAVQGRQ